MDRSSTRPEVVLAALPYLVTAHRTGPCAGLEACIERHFAILADHPDADPLLRKVAAASVQAWRAAAHEVPGSRENALH